MERNFRQRNDRPPLPTRGWPKKADPPSLSTTQAMTRKIGSSTRSKADAPRMSKVRFVKSPFLDGMSESLAADNVRRATGPAAVSADTSAERDSSARFNSEVLSTCEAEKPRPPNSG